MPFFVHDGIEFHFREEGAGRAFFFQHGLGADVSQPFSLFRPPAGIRLIAFDARAHGQTHPPGPPEKLGFGTFAGDLGALLDHLGLKAAVVGGISMGAGIALRVALQFPERVAGLVLSRPAWLDAPNPWNVMVFGLITRLIREHGHLRGKEMFCQTAEYAETRERWPDVAKSLALQFDSPHAEEVVFRYDRIVRDCPNWDREEWRAIGVPTLVLGNRLDPVHPLEYAQELARLIPGAELREITAKSVSVEQHQADVQRELAGYFQRHFP